MIYQLDINKDIIFLKEYFKKYTNKIFIVGGSVRDFIISKLSPKDYDLEVYNIDIDTFNKIAKELNLIGVGKSFFVYKYKNYIDISLPRIETKISKGHRGFVVKITNDEKIASRRRDFTMNALMYNIYTKEILDFYGGIDDIKNKKIVIIDENTFIEDSLRVLRGIRFSAQLGFKIDKKSINIMKKIDLNDLSKERIYLELYKLSTSKYLRYGFFYFYILDIDKKIFNIKLTKNEFKKIYKIFYKYKGKEFFFFYILNSFTKINLNILPIPNKLKKILKQPKFKIYSKKELLEISLDMPLRDFYALVNKEQIDFAKEYNIYNNKLKTDINIYDIIEDGFKKDEIKKELRRRELEYINKLIS